MSISTPESGGPVWPIEAELEQLKTDHVYRRLRTLETTGMNAGVIDGKHALLFASNDYLGLGRHPAAVKAASIALQEHGNSAGASRLICGNNALYRELEDRLAALKGKEAALVFPSGYMTNLGVLSTLTSPMDLVVGDKYNHASLYDACKLSGCVLKRYAHKDLAHLEKLLANTANFRRRIILTDGVFSADGDLAPLPEIVDLARKYDFRVIVDDAHGTGVLGPLGRGTTAHLKTEAHIEIGTLSKALGALGGFVAADRSTIDLLINRARPFIFTTGLPPATLAAAIESLKILEREPWRQQRVLELAQRVRATLSRAGFQIRPGPSPIIPIIIGDERTAVKMADICLENGVFIPAVRHPTVAKKQARLRMTLGAAHSDENVDMALRVLERAGRELGLL